MRIDRPIPFEAARAYGIGARRPGEISTAAPNADQSAATASHAQAHARTLPPNIARLIAGVVPGGIDFREGDALPTDTGSIAMYSRAGERNAAATGVVAGRLIDVQA